MPKAKTPAQKKKLSSAYRICRSKVKNKLKQESCVYDIYYGKHKGKKRKK